LAGGSWPLRVIASQRVRAKRGPMTGSANPGSLRGGILDCFVARAPRNDEQMAETSLLQFTFQIADAGSPSRGAWRPSFAQGAPSKKTRAQGRPGAGWHPRSVRDRNAHGVDHRCCRSPGPPCANGFNGVLRAFFGERCTIAPVALRNADARAGRPLHHRKTWRQNPGRRDHTTSPSAHVLAGNPRGGVCSPPKPCKDAVDVVS